MITGPNIITDDLVLYLDAANEKCFRGEPTTNVVANPLPNNGWVVSNFNSSVTRTFIVENGIKYMRLSNVTVSSGYPRIIDSVFNSNITGAFSTSFEARGTPGAELRLRIYENGATKITNLVTLTSEWVRYKFEGQTTGFNLNQPYFNPVTPDAIYEIKNIQIESKTYSTPFVDGARGTTVETGGGLFDLSRNGNNGELVNGITYSSSNGGALVFDGVDDRVSISNPLNQNNLEQIWTVSAWVNVNNNNVLQQLISGMNLGLNLNHSTTNRPLLYLNSGVNDYYIYGQVERILGKGWVYVTFTFRNSDGFRSIYINGGENISAFGPNKTSTPSGLSSVFNIGINMSGKLSQIQIYNRVLTPEEILQNYNATKSRFGL